MGEYIDRGKLIEKLKKDPLFDLVERYGIVEVIESIPAADVRPVKRGKWMADGDGYHWTYNCSICGWEDGYPFNERHNFCPNCGADMRPASMSGAKRVTCVDCQRDCQMIGLDMPACTAYEPPKEE